MHSPSRDSERPQETKPRDPLTRAVRLGDLPNTMFSDRERAATCECGRSFTQRQLTERELEVLERRGVIDSFLAAVPDAFVPVHCPPCEAADLKRQSLIDDARARSAASATLPDRRESQYA